jgi:hypothetical protein
MQYMIKVPFPRDSYMQVVPGEIYGTGGASHASKFDTGDEAAAAAYRAARRAGHSREVLDHLRIVDTETGIQTRLDAWSFLGKPVAAHVNCRCELPQPSGEGSMRFSIYCATYTTPAKGDKPAETKVIDGPTLIATPTDMQGFAKEKLTELSSSTRKPAGVSIYVGGTTTPEKII